MNEDLQAALIWVAIGAAVMAWQLSFCFLFKRVWLRLIPTVAVALATVAFYILALSVEGWDALGYVVLMIVGLIMFGVCLVSWIIWAIIRGIIRHRRKTKE